MSRTFTTPETAGASGRDFPLAEQVGLAPQRLDEVAAVADESYYVYPLITGRKKRWIEAPRGELKQLQRRLLDSVLYRLTPHAAAHGFVRGRSIVTNARRHCGRNWVVTMDIRNFFPSIDARRVDRELAGLPVNAAERATLVKLVTRHGRLPQGAPTSPHLANLVSRRLDFRLRRLAESTGWTYTRYADDMAFSGAGEPGKLIRIVEEIVLDDGFRPARHKTRVMSRHQRQVVTGLVVNEKVSLPRAKRRLLRAMLHRVRTADPGAAELPDLQIVHGNLALAALVDPAGYRQVCREVSQILEGRVGAR